MDVSAPWRLSPQVSVRPESFGALLYHFGTRKLSFLKDRRLLDVVERLEATDTMAAACDAAGIADADRPRYLRALETLASSDMIEMRAS
jgi:putative mycofactocin binding protein MftB